MDNARGGQGSMACRACSPDASSYAACLVLNALTREQSRVQLGNDKVNHAPYEMCKSHSKTCVK